MNLYFLQKNDFLAYNDLVRLRETKTTTTAREALVEETKYRRYRHILIFSSDE